jgi:hypothetical protein
MVHFLMPFPSWLGLSRPSIFQKELDCRVKPGNDEQREIPAEC